MPVGRPDWYVTGKSANTAGMSDLGELAARLGSCVVFDRTGKILHADNFNRFDGLYTASNDGTSTDYALQTTIAQFGSGCIKASTAVGVAKWVALQRRFRLWDNVPFSAELGILCNKVPDKVEVSLGFYIEPITYTAYFDIITGSTVVRVLNAAGAYQTVHTFSISAFNASFFTDIKIDVDLELFKYKRLLFNNTLIDLSAIELYSPGATTNNWIDLLVVIRGNAALAVDAYIGHLIFSEDE